MAAGSTYTPIATVTTAGSQSSVAFTSIPSTYTDLVIIEQSTGSVAGYSTIYFNTDNASTNYSRTYLFGNGSATFSGRDSNQSTFATIDYLSTSGTPNSHIYQINNYSNTTTYKTLLARYNLTNDGSGAHVGLWRSTAAINAITFTRASGTYVNGSTYTLYGIAAA
jgi:hypothetical protein